MLGFLSAKGMVPYTDFFDHKGPFLVLVEYLGSIISVKPIGNFIVQIPFAIFSFIGIYKIISKFSLNRNGKIVCYVISIMIFNIYYGSNMTEEYCMPFLIWSIYFATEYLLGNVERHKLSWSFLYGITIMVCVLTRITNVIPMAGFLLVGMIILIKNKDRFLQNLLMIILGMIVLVVPFGIFFAIKGNLWDMIYATLIYNFKYAVNLEKSYEMSSLLKIVVRKISLVVFAAVIGCINLINKKNINISLAIIISSVLAIILQVTSTMEFTQYLSVQVPVLIVAIGLINLKEVKTKIINYAIVVASIGVLLLGNVLSVTDSIKVKNNDVSYVFEKEVQEIMNRVENKDESKIIAYNVGAYFYLAADVKPCYKYCILQDWQTALDNDMLEEFMNQIESLEAEYIVESNNEGNMDSFINEHYKELCRTENMKLLKRID